MNTEDRDLFVKELNKVNLKVPVSQACETMEDAVVHIYNGLNEYAAVPDKYSSLEDILFRVI